MKYKKLYEEDLDTIEELKERLRESLTKKKKLMKKISESHEIIEKMGEYNDSDGSKEKISNLSFDSKKLSLSITKSQKELEEA